MSGKDATDAKRHMQRFTRKPGFKGTGWNWDILDRWLARTKLAPNRKAGVVKIIAELQGPPMPTKVAPKMQPKPSKQAGR
jgi:hypothetical protein